MQVGLRSLMQKSFTWLLRRGTGCMDSLQSLSGSGCENSAIELTVTIHETWKFSYKEDTQLQIAGRPEVLHHTDQNTLTRVKISLPV